MDEALHWPLCYSVIASPAPFHVSGAAAFLSAGVSVLVEKPLSANSKDAPALNGYRQMQGQPIVRIGYCLRFLSTAGIVRDILGSGRLGTLCNASSFVGQYLPDWRVDTDYRDSVSASKALGGGALLELSHELDLLNWFISGLDVSHSWLRTHMLLDLDVEECADLVLTTSAGFRVDVHMDFWQKDVIRRMEFFGTNGQMVWNLVSNTIEISQPNVATEVIVGPEEQRGEIYVSMLRAFEAEIAGLNSPPDPRLTTVEQAQLVMCQVDKAKEINAWTGSNTVPYPLLTDDSYKA
jgi:predicted dehydrogenase